MEEGMERAPVSTFVQLKAMVGRNYLLKKRLWRKTLAECLMPCWFLCILILINGLLPDPNYKPVGTESADTPFNLNFALKNETYPPNVYIIPDTEDVRRFTDLMQQHYNSSHVLNNFVNAEGPFRFQPLHFIYLDNETQLEEMYNNNDASHVPVELAVVFDGNPFTNTSYTIRNHPDKAPLPAPSQLYAAGDACRNPDASFIFPQFNVLGTCPINSYYYSNFLVVQTIVEGTWIELMNATTSAYMRQFSVQLFPKGAYVDNTSLSVLRFLVPFYMTLTLSQFILYLLTVIVGEKEKKIKEGLRMMGLKDSVYWASWFVIYLAFVVVLTCLATGVLFGMKVFANSNAGLVYLLFLLYDISVLALAFLITVFFDKARVAGIFGAMAVSFLNLFYYIQVATGDSTPTVVYWILGLISPTGFALGMDKSLLLEINDPRGVCLDTLWDGPGLPIAGAYIMLSFDTIFYILLAYYLDNVLPSEFGSKRPPWFCLMPSFWFASSKKPTADGYFNPAFDGYDGSAENNDIEAIPASMRGKEALRIRGLTKTFRPFGRAEIKAVRGLNMDVYEGQITAILGHNGAGKTTLFNMLTGMTTPTKGSAHLYGYDLSDTNQLQEMRRMTGVCPQHDVLFDLITPREHLAFYAKIRGVPAHKVDDEVEKTLKDIDLTTKSNTRAAKLSGGQKRKLSIGIALIGDPKIVFLDEPTAGVDPYSRRHLWTLLQQRKAGKVILLTTHFMDEADLLADRKAIVSKGKLRCLGSSLFLKNRFGLGYHLTFVLNDNFHDTEAIRSLVNGYVMDARVSRHFGRELSYVLPRQHVSTFPALFSRLESLVNSGEANRMGFMSYGVSMTTLEEVFLKLGQEAEMAERAVRRRPSPQAESKKKTKEPAVVQQSPLTDYAIPRAHLKDDEQPNDAEEQHNTTWQLLSGLDVPIRPKHKVQTLAALLRVRGINMLRDPMAVFFQVFMPVAFAALGIWLGTLQTKRTVETKRPFTIGMYGGGVNSPLLFSEPDNSIGVDDMRPFWENLTAFYNLPKLRDYTGNFTDILDMAPHWAAADTRNAFNLDALNGTIFNGSLTLDGSLFNLSQTSPINPFPWRHTRLRFNDTLVHSPPLMINAISNTIVKALDVAKNISLSVYPLPYTSPPGGFDAGQFTSAMFIGMLFVLAPSALACEVVLDREIQAKNLLRVNGLTFGVYYGSFFLVLGSMMIVTCVMILLLIVAFQLQALITPVAIGLLAVLYVLYSPAAIFFATCCSYLFKTMESAQSIFPNVSSFCGLVPYIVVMLCDVFRVGGSTDLATGLHIAFCFLDVLYIPYGILYFVNRVYFTCLLTAPANADVDSVCGNLSVSDYMVPEIYIIFIALLFQIFFYYFLLIVIDIKSQGGKVSDVFSGCSKSKSSAPIENGDDAVDYAGLGDSDVKAENWRVQQLLRHPPANADQEPVVLIQGLHKKYASAESDGSNGPCSKPDTKPKKVKPAVQSLSFAVQAGEVFGLLGHNGAGKTTTMKVITAEEAPTRGRIKVKGHDIVSNQSAAFQALGYCPQHDALWRNITVREHMETYAAIRGIEPSHIANIVDLFLKGLQIEEHADKYAKNCSGGTRRKLSYAIAMLGQPAIVLMDEPSTGMDPQSKRFLWNTISASFQGKRGAILTTHSMEEADALCSRLGIMVKGQLRCLGTGQHLKNRYGSGYLLELKLKSLASESSGFAVSSQVTSARRQRKDQLTAFITNIFNSATVQEDFEDRIIYAIAQENVVSLADTFQALEEARQLMSIEEYSFSQTTLEQVFIKFAHEQEDEEREDEDAEL